MAPPLACSPRKVQCRTACVSSQSLSENERGQTHRCLKGDACPALKRPGERSAPAARLRIMCASRPDRTKLKSSALSVCPYFCGAWSRGLCSHLSQRCWARLGSAGGLDAGWPTSYSECPVVWGKHCCGYTALVRFPSGGCAHPVLPGYERGPRLKSRGKSNAGAQIGRRDRASGCVVGRRFSARGYRIRGLFAGAPRRPLVLGVSLLGGGWRASGS